jgi:hypothetical protein
VKKRARPRNKSILHIHFTLPDMAWIKWPLKNTKLSTSI